MSGGSSGDGCKPIESFLQYLVDWFDLEETNKQLAVCDRQLSTARLSLQLSEEERRRAACLSKLNYLQTRLQAFEQRVQHQQQPQHQPTSNQSQTTQPQPEQLSISRSATTVGMRLTPSTHLLAQQERDRDIQQRRRRRAGRQLPASMTGAPLLGRSLAADEAPQTVQTSTETTPLPHLLTTPQSSPQLPPPPPPTSTPHPPPLPESVTRSAGFYKLGFGPGERGAAAPPLDGRLDGQRAFSLQRQQQEKFRSAAAAGSHHRHRRSGGGGGTYLDGQAKRLLRVTASSGQQQQQQQQPDTLAVRAAMRDYERTFLQPRNPVNSPEPEAYQQLHSGGHHL